jgi:hypothetical protein
MGKKIFISYKYGDSNVYPLPGIQNTKVRDYVDVLQDYLDEEDHINKGEADGEDLSDFKDETIESRLRDKIYDSSITIVLISKGMKNSYLPEAEQWIPWEISYSLKEVRREDRVSRTNALLAVVLPDLYGRYDYFITDKFCLNCSCRKLNTPVLFEILQKNMFNIKDAARKNCVYNENVFPGYPSYVHPVKWNNFLDEIGSYLDIALKINSNINAYEVVKAISQYTFA